MKKPRHLRPTAWFLYFVLLFPVLIAAQPQNGKLQIHFIDVGQGDGALVLADLGKLQSFIGPALTASGARVENHG